MSIRRIKAGNYKGWRLWKRPNGYGERRPNLTAYHLHAFLLDKVCVL